MTLSALLLAAFAAWLPAAPAQARCVSRPDSAASHYVENGTALALCRQDEVTTAAAAMAAENRLRALQAEMAARAQRQRLLATPVPEFGAPQAAW